MYKSLIAIIFLLVVSCKTKPEAVWPDSLMGEYIVQTLEGENVSSNGITLNFTADAVSGYGGCNNYSATYTLSRDAVKFSPAISTKKMCAEGASEEQLFFNVLGEADKYSLEGENLNLYANRELVLSAKLRD